MSSQPLAFVDLETTGANPVRDRITEIGIVRVDNGTVSRWSTLVHPGCRIPAPIQALTGITEAMVADAPPFEALACEIQAHLEGAIFVAHNARFDYGFLKNAFKRMGLRFRPRVLCTVKLSRALFPQYHRHGLDSLIERHGLEVTARHRALGDAELIWQFWQTLESSLGTRALWDAADKQRAHPALPAHLDAELLADLPDSPGVYLFYGEGDALLYVGKSVNLRQRVLSHFSADTREFRESRISQEIRRIEWRETVGELGALLLESWLIKTRQPIHNRALRRASELCTWRLAESEPGVFKPELVCGDTPDFARPSYGLFNTRREATNALSSLAEAQGLCLAALGLEKTTRPGRGCFAYQLKRCRGVCVGKEPAPLHSARLLAALARLRLAEWSYPGAIGLIERDPVSERTEVHVVDHWCYLGTASDEAQLADLLEGRGRGVFDRDTYRLLVKALDSGIEVRRLS